MVLECCYLPGSLDVPKPLELLQLEFPRKWIYSSSRVDCNFSMASSAARKTLIMLSQCFTPHAICCLFNHDSIFSLASLSPPSFFFLLSSSSRFFFQWLRRERRTIIDDDSRVCVLASPLLFDFFSRVAGASSALLLAVYFWEKQTKL